ncbi:Potassium efflux system KefA protein, Small-conductance mechanosensitive channel [Fructilactobacillus florum 8D]|uniref:Potassium efflux system KefA protein, Small-conductance mechanosensitive channel n=1 Tax=Fructilactobacillus florum 8D TaxID=1221538 RepID=W9EJR8_9LACO|nr:mechanosensitive ion channel domain-containing protein [Fructilactobacillus florum]ETO39909.1 Potassium efflux system KefA protein, Small-conductance mechanosensitive channel [Fructilactobacillus florum 8D]
MNSIIETINTAAAVTQQQLTNFLAKFDWDQLIGVLLSKIISIVLISILFLIIAQGGRHLIARVFQKNQQKFAAKNPQTTIVKSKRRNQTFYSLVENAYYYLVVFFWLYSILSIIGIPVGTLIAGAGIFSLAVGLGAQGFVSDIVSGFFIISEQQLAVGEHVIINNIDGTVSAVGLRTTQIKTDNGTLNFIPNRNITTIANLSRSSIQTSINVRITPETNLKAVEKIIQQTNEKLKGQQAAVLEQPVILGPVYLNDGSLAIQTNVTTKSGTESLVQATYLAAYLEALTQAGIELPLSPQSVPVPASPANVANQPQAPTTNPLKH